MPYRTVILGTGSLAQTLMVELAYKRHVTYRLIGTISEVRNAATNGIPCPCLGDMSELQSIIAQEKVERIILAFDEKYDQLPTDRLVETLASQRITIESGIEVLEKLTGKFPIDCFLGSYALFSNAFRHRPVTAAACRMMSFAFSIPALLLCLPLMGIIAAAIRLDSPGPILFIQERIGYGDRRFRLLKFRSMFTTTTKRSEWACDNQDEITRVGQLLRKFRLDELPQFINVIRGDMNLVGPRPYPASNRELFTLVARNAPDCGRQTPYYSIRHSVRPGITGWAQVRYKYANGLTEEIEKLQYDLYYIKHYSLLLDINILLRTVKIVFLGRNDHTAADDTKRKPAGSVGESLTHADVGTPNYLLPRHDYGKASSAPGTSIRQVRNIHDHHPG